MAYQVLHTAKCNKTVCKGTEIHNERKITGKQEVSEYQSHTNENIDPKRTPLNVALVGDMQTNYYQLAKARITETRGGVAPNELVKNDDGKVIMRRLRKDAVWTADTVISASPEFFKERFNWDKDIVERSDFDGMNEYFKQGLLFMQEKYSKDNVIGAIIHYDETTPHMHVHWTPIKDGKLSYKSLSSPQQLRSLQSEFNEYIRAKGYELERGEVDSKRKHLEQQTEKLNMAIKENDKKLAELERVKSDYEIAKDGSHSLPSIDPTKSKAKDIQSQNEALRLANRDLKNRLAAAEQKIERIEKANADYQKKEQQHKDIKRRYLDYSDRQAAYKDYLKINPKAMEEMKPFDKENVYMLKFGKALENNKRSYVKCSSEQYNIEDNIANVKANIGTERAIIKHINDSSKQLNSLRASLNDRRESLEPIQGKLFKAKDRKALQSEIDGLNAEISTIEQNLHNRYGLNKFQPKDLDQERMRHQVKVTTLSDKMGELENTLTDVKTTKVKHLREYKYLAVRAKSFRKEWENIINRFDKNYEPPEAYKYKLNINRLTADERTYIKNRLDKNGLSENTMAFKFVTNQESKSRSRYGKKRTPRTMDSWKDSINKTKAEKPKTKNISKGFEHDR